MQFDASNLLSSTVVTPLEYKMVSPSLAQVTASIANYSGPEDMAVSIQAAFKEDAAPIRGSFRWLDSNRTAVIGFVQAARQSVAMSKDGSAPKGFRAVAGNMFMDEADENLWSVRQGAGQNYLVRQGTDDLSAVIQASRQTPVGNQPRMSSIRAAAAQQNEFMAFINTTGRIADVDYGFVLSAGADGSAEVLSVSTGREMVVPKELLVATYEVDQASMPKIPQEHVQAYKKTLKAASSTDAKLSPRDYYKLAYSYAPEYVAKIMKQIGEMAAV